MKILLFDIECTPALGYVWQKWQTDVIQFKDEWHLLSIAYKWFGEKEIHCISMQNQLTDKQLVSAFYKILSQADVVVAHNGDSFDVKKCNARFLRYGLPPLPKVPSIDTKKEAKKRFSFLSNSLNDLGVSLGLGKKAKHSGFETWLGCMANKPAAWKEMIHYNKKDVELLEKVYVKLRPWMTNHPSLSVSKGVVGCPNCGTTNCQRRGKVISNTGAKQRWQCQECGNWFSLALSKEMSK